jgi:hypothetical protein
MPDDTDKLSNELEERLTADVDRTTLKAGISLRDTAQIYRELASAFRDRAAGLDQEADANGED